MADGSILVKNSYSYEQFIKYYKKVNNSGAMGMFKKMVMFFICPLLLACLLYGVIDTRMEPGVTTAFAAVLVMTVAIVYIQVTGAKRRYRQEQKRFDTAPDYYLFSDEGISVVKAPDVTEAPVGVKYEQLHRVHEDGEGFYIYYSPFEALIAAKANIVRGTAEELSRLLREKLDDDSYSGA